MFAGPAAIVHQDGRREFFSQLLYDACANGTDRRADLNIQRSFRTHRASSILEFLADVRMHQASMCREMS